MTVQGGGNATQNAHDESGSGFTGSGLTSASAFIWITASKSQISFHFVGLFYDFSRRDFCISVCTTRVAATMKSVLTVVTRPRASLNACTCVCTWLNREYS